ncbi:MAG: hypothetical protein ABJG88_10765 [Litorimonas sp.]
MGWNGSERASEGRASVNVSDAELDYLRAGLSQSGGKLPLFDVTGQRINPKAMRSCIQKGLCEPWFANPMKPDWLVCRLTDKGRAVLVKQRARTTLLS